MTTATMHTQRIATGTWIRAGLIGGIIAGIAFARCYLLVIRSLCDTPYGRHYRACPTLMRGDPRRSRRYPSIEPLRWEASLYP